MTDAKCQLFDMLCDLLKTQTVWAPKEAAHPEALQPTFLLDTCWTPADGWFGHAIDREANFHLAGA